MSMTSCDAKKKNSTSPKPYIQGVGHWRFAAGRMDGTRRERFRIPRDFAAWVVSIGLRLGGRGSGSGPVLGALLHIQYFTTLERFLSVIGRRRRTMWRIPRTSQHSLAGLVALWRCGALLGKRTDSFIRSASSRSIRCKVCMLCVYECRCMYACLLPHPFSRYRRKSLSAFYMQGLHRPHRLRRFARPAGRRALAAGGAGWLASTPNINGLPLVSFPTYLGVRRKSTVVRSP